MSDSAAPKGKWSLSLTGRFAQFNLSLLLILVTLVAMFVLCLRSSSPSLAIGGPVALFVVFVGCVVFACRYYSKHEPRPDGTGSSIELQGAAGQKALIKNPPDTFFTQGHSRELVRALILGYDADLCPDGRVIGKVADQNYQMYTDEEKRAFMTSHREEIRGKKQRAIGLLTDEVMPNASANKALQATSEPAPNAGPIALEG